jgi:putative peptidoglycan lipid II flippase
MDTFSLAFGVASLFISLLAGNLNAAFIPSYTSLRTQCNGATARALFQSLLWRLALALGFLALTLALTCPIWLHWIAPRWAPLDLARLRHLLFLFLAWVPFGGITMLSAAALQGEERFAVPALLPALTSLTIIGALALSAGHSAFPIGWGIFVGTILEVMILVRILRWYSPRREPMNIPSLSKAISSVGHQYLPTVAAGILINTTPLVDMAIAGWLPPGTVAILAYANKVPSVVISLSAGALGTTLLPVLSRMVAERQWKAIHRLVGQASLLACVAGVSGALILGFCSPWIVRLLFMRGAFHPDRVPTVSNVQVFYLLQLPFALGSTIMVRLISALQGNHILFWGTLISASLNLGLDLLFLPFLGTQGIALSTVCVAASAWVFLSFWALRLLRTRERMVQ